jgi:membrane protein
MKTPAALMRRVPVSLQRLLRLVPQVGRRFAEDDCFNRAASLTFTTLLALVPLVTIGLAIFSAFPAFKTFTTGVNEFISDTMLPSAVGQIVSTHLEEFTRSAGRLTALGMTVLTITAVLLMQTIDVALQKIFRVQRHRPLGVRVLVYWGVLTLGPLLIGVSLSMTSYFIRASTGMAQRLDVVMLLDLVPLLLTAVAFTLLYFIVPNRRINFRHALIGGLFAALLFETMKRTFAFYVAQFPTYTLIYGAFAAIPIFLLWIYLSWLVVLLGAVLAASLPNWRAPRYMRNLRPIEPVSDLLTELFGVLRALVIAQRDNRVLSTAKIAMHAGLPFDATERMLESLANHGWVTQSLREHWTLSCDSHGTQVAHIFDSLLFKEGAESEPLIETLRRANAAVLQQPLANLHASRIENERDAATRIAAAGGAATAARLKPPN